jgi:hypothetical protein
MAMTMRDGCIGATLLAALLAGGCMDDTAPVGPPAKAGDFPDGTLLRLRLTRVLSVGTVGDCALRPSWTWRYWSLEALVPDGPNPRNPELVLTYDPVSHTYFGQQESEAPVGYRADSVRLFQGGVFSHTAWWWDDHPITGRNDCASSWEGIVEVVPEG